MNYEYEKIGERIKTERKKLRMTQEAFAEKYHVKRATVSKWEHGIAMPNFQTMLDICADFNCELGYLLCENGYENKTRETTDICKATGLSEKVAEKLQEERAQLIMTNAAREQYNLPILKNTLFTNFVNFFMENGEKVYVALNDIVLNMENLKTFKEEKTYPLIRKVFREINERSIDIPLLENGNQEGFYTLLEIEMRDKEAKNDLKNLGEWKKEVSDTTIVPKPPKAVRVARSLSNGADEISEKIEVFKGLELYEALKMDRNARYLKYELADVFMDIVNGFLKEEGVEDGRKDELQEKW